MGGGEGGHGGRNADFFEDGSGRGVKNFCLEGPKAFVAEAGGRGVERGHDQTVTLCFQRKHFGITKRL